MKVGDYIRTSSGKIAKYLGHEEDKYKFDEYIYWYYEYYNDYVYDEDYEEWLEEEEVKVYKNLIDLIEVGDLVYVDISPDDCDGIIVPRITETENELNSLKLLIENKDYILKSITTHEQIENMEYKVKE